MEVNVLKRFHSMDNPNDIFDEELLSFYVRQVCRNRLRNRPRPGAILDSSDEDDDDDDHMQVEAIAGPGPLPCSPS